MTAGNSAHPSLADVFADDPVSSSLARIIRDLAPGERLPSERDLAQQLDVSRTALRDRLGVLEGLGVLRRHKGSGTYVEVLKTDSLTLALNLAISASHLPMQSLESVRIALERQAAAEAAQQSDPVLIAHMQRAVETMASSTIDAEVMEADRTFHQALLRAAENPALTFFAAALADVLAQDVAERSARLDLMRLSTPSKQLMVHHHSQIHAAIVSGDSEAAMHAIDEHFAALPAS